LTKAGMANQDGSHAAEYSEFLKTLAR
jgi:hypothetical protein